MTATGEPPAWHLRWGQPEPYTDDDPNDSERTGRGHRFEAHVAAHDPAGAGERWATSDRTIGLGRLSRRPDIISVCPDGSLEIGECKMTGSRVASKAVRQAAEGRDAAAEALGPGKVNETAVLHWRGPAPTEKTVTEAAALNVHLVCWISDTDRADAERRAKQNQQYQYRKRLQRDRELKRERYAALSDEQKAEHARRQRERYAALSDEQKAERARRQRERRAKNGRRGRPRRGKPGPGQRSLGV